MKWTSKKTWVAGVVMLSIGFCIAGGFAAASPERPTSPSAGLSAAPRAPDSGISANTVRSAAGLAAANAAMESDAAGGQAQPLSQLNSQRAPLHPGMAGRAKNGERLTPAASVPSNSGDLLLVPSQPTTFVVKQTGSRLYTFDTSVGSAAPPDTLGGFVMTPFGVDPSPGGYNPTTSVADPCDAIPGSIGFSPAIGHATIGSGWMTWSHGYTGDIYYTLGALSVTITLPPVTNCAFYWYTEPNPFSEQTFLVEADDGSSTTFTANGSAGAAYCGVYGGAVQSVTITCTSGNDFAIGEFGIACLCEGQGACCDISTAECREDIEIMDCIDTGPTWRTHPFQTCADLVPPCGNPGACCDIYTGDCSDDVLEYNCANEFHGGQQCAEMNPACGDPGCCCDSPEPGVLTDPHFAYRANCTGRFLSGVVEGACTAAAFSPECGLWQPTGVMYAPTNPDNAGFRSAVAALLNSPVDYFDARGGTPTLEQLQPYAAVLTWGNYAYADKIAMGDVLADFVDANGKVILGQWCFHTTQVNWLEGRIMTADYCPAICSSYSTSAYTYTGDGEACVFNGPAGTVGAMGSSYTDVISGLQPAALSDGHWAAGSPVVAYWPQMNVYYSSGNSGLDFCTGDWAILTANMVLCTGGPGACCDISTAECLEMVPVLECLGYGPTWRTHPDRACADLVPVCGDPGACCDIYSGACIDDVLKYNCLAISHQFWSGQQCGELNPPCGDPGCCCEGPEEMVITDPVFAYRANCNGRFVSGATPLCGDLDGNGVVDMTDYNMFLDAFGKCDGQPGYVATADLDGDGCVDLVDFQIWRNCYEYPGTGCAYDMFTPYCGLWVPVGLLYAPAEADAASYRAAVSALIGQPVDYFDARSATPSVDLMSQYAAVLTWVNYPLFDNVTMGNNMADYVDLGGRALLGQWCFPTAGNYLAGRIMTADYCPVATAAGWGAGSYSGPSDDCVTQAFAVSALASNYLDNITGLVAGSFSDGTFTNGAPVAAWRPDRKVYYSAGNMGAMYGATGNWAELTANYIVCPNVFGACCNPYTQECVDDVTPLDCSGLQWFYNQQCAFLDPVCGDPGCCCESPEEMVVKDPVEMLHIYCDGRFLSAVVGADCVAAAFSPECGLWQPTGVLYAPTQPDNPGFRAAVSALLMSPVDYFDARVGTPTLDQLAPYAAVLTWVNYAYADRDGMGNVLADFVDANGKVILGQWCLPTAGNYLGGRIMTADYCPATATSYSSGTYAGDGVMCPFDGPYGVVGSGMSSSYCDNITPRAGALSDGTMGGHAALAFWGSFLVYYSPGNTGLDFTTGDVPILTANMVVCTGGPGACCDRATGDCVDQLPFAECTAQGPAWQWHMGYCADLVPVCGEPGACCNIYTGECIDEVLKWNCADQFWSAQNCSELTLPCGDPGCCCDYPESGVPTPSHFAYHANCTGRFISGGWEPFDCATFTFVPECGLWQPVGLLYAPAEADAAAYRAAVAALIGQNVDYFDARVATPSVEQMSQYAAVLTWVNYALADNVLMGNNLADYVDQGGRAILGQWCFHSTQLNWLEGRIMTAAYCPVATASGYGSASLATAGSQCAFIKFPVTALYSAYVDAITGLVAGSVSDGTFTNGAPVAVWRPDYKVWYSAGNMGAMFGATGNWAQLTANEILCPGNPGACCDPYEAPSPGAPGYCLDDVQPLDCTAPQILYEDQTCAALDPPCGNPGACCDDLAEPPVCEDGVLAANCATRHVGGTLCADIAPECGAACPHSVNLYDSYGDGWTGNTLDVYVNGAIALSGITLPSGPGPLSFTFYAGTGSEIHTVYNAIGTWTFEPYYRIYDGTGAFIIQDGGLFIQPTGVTVYGNCGPTLNFGPARGAVPAQVTPTKLEELTPELRK